MVVENLSSFFRFISCDCIS